MYHFAKKLNVKVFIFYEYESTDVKFDNRTEILISTCNGNKYSV